MDLSAFNFLMSTTPNAAGLETPFSAAESNAVAQASKSGDTMKTGDAFLKVLDRVRSGKTERSAENFFSNMSARADNASAMKDFRTKGGASENIRVVKIHLKRTRACEKTNEDRQVQTAAADVSANGQKIPVPEKNVETPAAQVIVVPQSDGAETLDRSDFPVIETAVAPVDRNDGEAHSVPADELTAADVLIRAALQGAAGNAPVPETAVAPRVIETAVPVGQIADRQVGTQDDDAPVMRNLPVDAPEQNGVKTAAAAPVAKMPETAVVRTDDDFSVPAVKNEPIVSGRREPRTVETVAPVETPVVEAKPETSAVAAEPVHLEKAAEKRSAVQAENNAPVAADTPDMQDYSFDFDQTPDARVRRQADDLARRLPSDVKIAVSVEINAPAEQAAPERRELKPRDVASRKTAAKPDETSALPFDAEPERGDCPAERTAVKSFDKALPHRQENARPAAGEGENVVLPPVERTAQTFAAAEKSAESGSQAAANAAAPASSAPAGQTFAAVHQGLKGKAVSGTAPAVHHAPAREVADQIKVSIKKALKAGLDKIDVVVKHKELGTIKVHLEIDKDGNMKAVLSSARSETVDLLRADLEGLKQSLADSGFNMNDESFAFNYRGERFDDDGRGENGRRETADAADAATGDAANEATDSGRYALNIRV